MDNNFWAHSLIDQLILQGVSDFCIAPGSRSTPLALAAARHEKAHIHVHFDERGLGFFALGSSLAKQIPAAIIVTSGTAVGNLLPAVMEAYHSHVPLILLTADRPPELHDCGAMQSTDQIKLFENFVIWQTDLPCPHTSLSSNFICSQAAYAVFQALQMGPVHLNCQFREPLYSPSSDYSTGTHQPYFSSQPSIDQNGIEHCKQLIINKNRGVILIGRMPPHYDLGEIFLLAKRLQWPIVADLLSGARCQQHSNELFIHFDYAIKAEVFPKPEVIIHFGGPFISSAILAWMKQIEAPIIHIHHFSERIDPMHLCPTRIHSDPTRFCQAFSINDERNSTYLNECRSIDDQISQNIQTCFSQPHPLTEADMMRALGDQLPPEWSIFLANGMPVRDAEHFFFPKKPKCIFANRGLSGIDGQIATAAGIAQELQSPLIAIIGDQSSLHDLNSIALLRSIQHPFLLVVSNNFGGGIFSRLSVAHEPKHFDRLFNNQHAFRFEKIAEMFNLPYFSSSSIHWGRIFCHPKPVILEVITSQKNNASFENQIMEKCIYSKKNKKTGIGQVSALF